MVIEIDFNSDEAIYVQLMNQIIMGIATSRLQEGDPLPSVRQLADTVGINMHTVNKHILCCVRKVLLRSTADVGQLSLWMLIRSKHWKK